MRFLAVSLRKDLARVRRDPSSLLTAICIPLVLAVLMTVIFGRDPVIPHGRLLVADEDHSFASASLLNSFHNGQFVRMLTLEMVSPEDGRARIDRGDASAFLIIPRGFQQAYQFNRPFPLPLFTNPAERILPQILQQALSVTLDVASDLRRGVRAPQDMVGDGGLITLQTAVTPERRRSVNFALVFLPSMLFMGMLFIANSLAGDIWRERTAGTLRRLASSPVPLSAYLVGRVVFVAIVYGLVALIGLAAAQRLAGMPVANLPAAILWMAFSGIVFYLLFLCIAMQASTQRGAAVLANLVIFPLSMLGGSFFPFEWMPRWMATVGRLTPNGWAITQFQTILNGAASAAHLAGGVAALVAFSAVTFFFALRRLRTGFAV